MNDFKYKDYTIQVVPNRSTHINEEPKILYNFKVIHQNSEKFLFVEFEITVLEASLYEPSDKNLEQRIQNQVEMLIDSNESGNKYYKFDGSEFVEESSS